MRVNAHHVSVNAGKGIYEHDPSTCRRTAPTSHCTVNTPADKNGPVMLTTPPPLRLYVPDDRPGLYV